MGGFSTRDHVRDAKRQILHFDTNFIQQNVGSVAFTRSSWWNFYPQQNYPAVGTGFTDIGSPGNGGTYFVSSWPGFHNYSNPDSVNAESLCIIGAQFTSRINDMQALVIDRVWEINHIQDGDTFNVVSIAFVRSFDANHAMLFTYIRSASINTVIMSLSVSYLDAGGNAKAAAIDGGIGVLGHFQIFPIMVSSGISRVLSGTFTGNDGLDMSVGLLIAVPKFFVKSVASGGYHGPFQTGMSLVASNEALSFLGVVTTFASSVNVGNQRAHLMLELAVR